MRLRLSTVELAEHDECADDARRGSAQEVRQPPRCRRLRLRSQTGSVEESHPYVADQHDKNQCRIRPEDGGRDEGDCSDKAFAHDERPVVLFRRDALPVVSLLVADKEFFSIRITAEKSTSEDFRELDVWRRSHELVQAVYRATKRLPKEEMFGLTVQLAKSWDCRRRRGLQRAAGR